MIADQREEAGRLCAQILALRPDARVWDFEGTWAHTAEMQPWRRLPRVARPIRATAVARRAGAADVALGARRCRPSDERRLEVGEQVVGRLDPDREAHEVPGRCERRARGRRVGHPRWMLDQALDTAERLRELEDLRPCDELDRLLLGVEEERDHPAEVAHLARATSCPGWFGRPG